MAREVAKALPPFNETATCCKCGHGVIYTQHHNSGYYCGFRHRVANSEHLHRGCRRCGYQWAESTRSSMKVELEIARP